MKRRLTEAEIEDILSFITINPEIPPETALTISQATTTLLTKQLEKISIYPELIPELRLQMKESYFSSLIQPGECVGIITAQSIGERQTQTNLNNFHKAGSADKQPIVSKFSELLNATSKPRAPSYWIYFNQGNGSISELRETIGHSIVQLTFKKITKSFSINLNKDSEIWYDIFKVLYPYLDKEKYTDCISLDIDMDILYEHKLTLKNIADLVHREYSDLYCIFSPDCFGRLDIFVDTESIELPEEKLIFVTKENIREIYLEEVVQPIIENIIVCGIPGILNMFFVQEDRSGKEWIIETENTREKISEPTRFKNTREKPADSTKRYKILMAHPCVDATRTISNNIWDIFYTLGIEATRQYMIEQFSEIMGGINMCHVMLLVDKMTFCGTISSISRYTMRREESGPFGKASFEETLDNFLTAGVYGQEEPTRGVSASIICGKRAQIGTGLCELAMDISKLSTIDEAE